MSEELEMQKGKDVIFEQLKQFLSEMIGEDVVEEMDITGRTIFSKDLELSSIEIVTLAEKVNSYYGKNLDFSSWLYSLKLNALINLSVDDVVNYISESIGN